MAKRTKKSDSKPAAKKRRAPKDSISEEIPPGATRKALDRPLDPGGGLPGSGAGPRHAAGDEGSDVEETGPMDTNRSSASSPVEEEDPLETGPPYAGISGGAVGGSPAEV